MRIRSNNHHPRHDISENTISKNISERTSKNKCRKEHLVVTSHNEQPRTSGNSTMEQPKSKNQINRRHNFAAQYSHIHKAYEACELVHPIWLNVCKGSTVEMISSICLLLYNPGDWHKDLWRLTSTTHSTKCTSCGWIVFLSHVH